MSADRFARAHREPGGRPRRRISWKNVILAGAVAVGVIVYLKMATARFKWWDEASFAGQVAGKEALLRDTDQPVDEATALAEPKACRFFLDIATDKGTARHEVVLSLYRKARVGDHVAKPAGTYRARHTPGHGPPPAPPEPPKP